MDPAFQLPPRIRFQRFNSYTMLLQIREIKIVLVKNLLQFVIVGQIFFCSERKGYFTFLPGRDQT